METVTLYFNDLRRKRNLSVLIDLKSTLNRFGTETINLRPKTLLSRRPRPLNNGPRAKNDGPASHAEAAPFPSCIPPHRRILQQCSFPTHATAVGPSETISRFASLHPKSC